LIAHVMRPIYCFNVLEFCNWPYCAYFIKCFFSSWNKVIIVLLLLKVSLMNFESLNNPRVENILF